jgi:CheY-like chemotaxis protein
MKKILIIDDEESICTSIEMILQDSGYTTLRAGSGSEGLRMAREHLPDLTLCDVNMPDMNGRTVLQEFRKDAELKTRAFVMMTGNTADTPQRTGMNLGADDYLAKPFEIPDLLQCVQTRLKKAELLGVVEGKLLQEMRTAIHSTMPHEFYTPLTGIIGLSDILKEDARQLTPEEVIEYATDIGKSGQRLYRTLRNYLKILDLEQSHAAAGTVHQPAALGMEEAKAVVETNARSVTAKYKRGADLTLQFQPCSPCIDQDSLASLTEELVENACSFSAPGRAILVEFFPDKNRTVLRVTDQGRGMTAEQIDRVGAFTQFDRKRYEQQGLGLGLTLASRQLERVGGSLPLQSKVGEGTTAVVSLP